MFRFLVLILAVFIPKGISADRIVGGSNADIKDFPHQISLHQETIIGPSFVCGGSIIRNTVVLTAAHCYKKVNNYVVRYGSTMHGSGGTLVNVIKAIPHERYNLDGQFTNDVALLLLNTPIVYSENAKPIELAASTEKLPPGTIVTVTGWGMLSFPGSSPEILQKINMPIVDINQCAALAATQNKQIYTGMICAGFANSEGQGACKGDSGGPLIYNGKQYGVVSWAIKLCAKGFPDVYTDVAYYREWIDSKLNNLI